MKKKNVMKMTVEEYKEYLKTNPPKKEPTKEQYEEALIKALESALD